MQVVPTSSSHGSLKAENFSRCGRSERDVMIMEEASERCDLLALKMKEGIHELRNADASKSWEQPSADSQQGSGDLSPTTAMN